MGDNNSVLCVGRKCNNQYYNNNFNYYTFFLRIIILYHILGGFEYISRITLLTFILTWKDQKFVITFVIEVKGTNFAHVFF